jgi:RNA polymerase sigma-70 factor, ECF subfamily
VTPQSDLTGLLQAWSSGDREALARLAPLVHEDLRQMARRILAGERRREHWRTTELLQESFVRLLDWRAAHWQSRAHFFGTAARMMRRALVDAARARRAAKRNNGADALPLDDVQIEAPGISVDLVALEEALRALETKYPRAGHVVELRFFGGFTVEETAEALGVSVRTVINDWNTARAWLHGQLSAHPHRDSAGQAV